MSAEIEEDICPECGNPLRPIWHGLNACFCRFGGRQPDADEIADMADEDERKRDP